MEKQTFEEAVKPLIKWVAENCNPHATVLVDCTSAELLQGSECVINEEFLVD